MNPESGGGKVEKFDLQRKAEALGAEVFLIGGWAGVHTPGSAVIRPDLTASISAWWSCSFWSA